MNLTKSRISEFKEQIWAYYRANGRVFAWRHVEDPYQIVVSEIMLQQTQTYRVAPKYEAFIALFPTWHALASASTHDLLCAWQGLGYNRRALALQAIAKRVVADFDGNLPDDPKLLVEFPGIGKATAGSICAFAFNRPTVFIETNIRAVFIHFFFKDKTEVRDDQLMSLVAKTVDHENPREWYYALMDYGVMLKKSQPNPSRQSRHYTKQSRFEGSDRQIRGAIIRALTQRKSLTLQELIDLTAREPERVIVQVDALRKEGFIEGDSKNTLRLR